MQSFQAHKHLSGPLIMLGTELRSLVSNPLLPPAGHGRLVNIVIRLVEWRQQRLRWENALGQPGPHPSPGNLTLLPCPTPPLGAPKPSWLLSGLYWSG